MEVPKRPPADLKPGEWTETARVGNVRCMAERTTAGKVRYFREVVDAAGAVISRTYTRRYPGQPQHPPTNPPTGGPS